MVATNKSKAFTSNCTEIYKSLKIKKKSNTMNQLPAIIVNIYLGKKP